MEGWGGDSDKQLDEEEPITAKVPMTPNLEIGKYYRDGNLRVHLITEYNSDTGIFTSNLFSQFTSDGKSSKGGWKFGSGTEGHDLEDEVIVTPVL